MANLLVAVEMTTAQVAANHMTTPAGIYLAQLQQTTNSTTIGLFVTDIHGNRWFYVGPGTRPTVQQISGNQFLVLFDYLSHLTIRLVDISTWPPTQVDPTSIAGGPNPPNPFLYGFTFLNDAYAMRLRSASSTGESKNQFGPPYLQPTPLFFDPLTNTFSVTLTPNSTWITNIPNTTNYFRLYRSPLGPPTWTLIQDWSTTLNYTDSQVGGPFQFQYAATIGAYFNPANPGSIQDHEESLKGQPLAFDSTHGPLGYDLAPYDPMTLIAGGIAPFADLVSTDGYGVFSAKSLFIVQVLADTLPMTDGDGEQTSAFSSMGGREGFIVFFPLPSDSMGFGNSASYSYSNGGNAACSLFS